MNNKIVVKNFDGGEGYTANEKNAGEMVAALQSAGVTSAEIYWYPEYTNGFQAVGVQVDEVQWQAHLVEVARLQTASETPKNIYHDNGKFSHFQMRIQGVVVEYTPYTGGLWIEECSPDDTLERQAMSEKLRDIELGMSTHHDAYGFTSSGKEIFIHIAKQYFPEWEGYKKMKDN